MTMPGGDRVSYVKPDEIVNNMVAAGAGKGKLMPRDLLIRGFLSGALLGFATTLAFQTNIQFGGSIIGAVIFPVGFVMIVLLGLELVTGNFALVPLAILQRKITLADLSRNWSFVFIGNLLGSLAYAGMFFAATTGTTPVTDRLVEIAQAKTIAYESQGLTGLQVVFFKAVLCNWMVTMGVVMAMTSTTTAGKIVAMWLPIMTFFAQGFEHSVVNMFVIPTGMAFGADISLADWWLWNQIPVTLGNIAGGLLFTGLALYVTHGRFSEQREPAPAPAAHESVPALVQDASRV
jgi:formate/nitrite transporter